MKPKMDKAHQRFVYNIMTFVALQGIVDKWREGEGGTEGFEELIKEAENLIFRVRHFNQLKKGEYEEVEPE